MKKGYRKNGKKSNHCSKKVVKCVKKVVKSELKKETEEKWFGTGFTPVAVYSGNAGGYGQINMTSMVRGTGDSDRVGDEVIIKNITVRVALCGPRTSGNSFQHIRLMVFQVKNQTTGGFAPTVTELLISDTATATYSTFGGRAPDYMFKYVMLYDKTYTVTETDDTSYMAANHVKFVTIRVPLKYARRKLHYRGNNTDSDGSIYLAWIGSEPSSATNATIQAEFRTLYTDA